MRVRSVDHLDAGSTADGISDQRAQEYTAKIDSGDVISLSEVVRDLQRAPDGSGSFGKRNLFELAIERLAGEFAAASGTTKASAVVRRTQTLQQARADQAKRLLATVVGQKRPDRTFP